MLKFNIISFKMVIAFYKTNQFQILKIIYNKKIKFKSINQLNLSLKFCLNKIHFAVNL